MKLQPELEEKRKAEGNFKMFIQIVILKKNKICLKPW